MPSNDEDTRKAITAAVKRAWVEKNREAVAAYQREYDAKNRETILANKRRRYQEETPEEREKRDAYIRDWQKKNHEARLEHQRRYREKNRSKLREDNHKYRKDANGEPTAQEKVRQARHRVQRAQDLETMAGRPRPEVCDACGGAPDKGKSLHFDHCHRNGHFRGWLCRPCNLVLGHVGDDPDRLRRLIAYVQRTKDGPVDHLNLSGV